MYGFYLLGYMFLQFVFAAMNNIKLQRLQSDRRRTAKIIKRTNIMVVGHKEDPEYFRWMYEKAEMPTDTKMIARRVYAKLSSNE